MQKLHLPLPPSWEHTVYIAHIAAGEGAPQDTWRLIQITEATTGPSLLDDTATTLDVQIFGLSDWPDPEQARQAAQDAGLTIRAREDLFAHIAYLRDRARKIHAAIHLVSDRPAPPRRPIWPRPTHLPATFTTA